MYLHSDSSHTGTRNLVSIINDHASATGTTLIKLDNDANSYSLHIKADGLTTSKAIGVEDSTLTTGNLAQFYSNSST